MDDLVLDNPPNGFCPCVFVADDLQACFHLLPSKFARHGLEAELQRQASYLHSMLCVCALYLLGTWLMPCQPPSKR